MQFMKHMKCEICGQELTNDMKFCTNCGSPVTQSKAISHNSGSIDDVLVSTTSIIQGFRIIRYCNTISATNVKIAVRRSGFFEAFDALSGNLGDDTYLRTLLEESYNKATNRLIIKAKECGCNAILGVRYIDQLSEEGIHRITAYGTACIIEEE